VSEVDKAFAAALFEPANVIEASDKNARVRALSANLVYSPPLYIEYVKLLAELREELLDRLDETAHLTDCSLPVDARRLILPDRSGFGVNPAEDMRAVQRAFDQLRRLLLRYLQNCLCLALLPACSPCEDTAVLLACLEVKGCEIVRICNLERSFVLSPAAMRYWAPPLRLLGEAVERLCCREIEIPAPSAAQVGVVVGRPDLQSERELSSVNSAMLNTSFALLARAFRADQRQLKQVAYAFAGVSSEPVSAFSAWFDRAAAGPAEPVLRALSGLMGGRPLDEAGALDAVANLIDARVEAKLAERLKESAAPAQPAKSETRTSEPPTAGTEAEKPRETAPGGREAEGRKGGRTK
jgi:hypothetical protein